MSNVPDKPPCTEVQRNHKWRGSYNGTSSDLMSRKRLIEKCGNIHMVVGVGHYPAAKCIQEESIGWHSPPTCGDGSALLLDQKWTDLTHVLWNCGFHQLCLQLIKVTVVAESFFFIFSSSLFSQFFLFHFKFSVYIINS